jgi:hypothetical protein
LALSAVSGEGMSEVLRALAAQIVKDRKRTAPEPRAEAWTP